MSTLARETARLDQLRRIACVDIPELPLQMLLRAHPNYRDAPVAVVAEERPEAELLLINRHARALRLSTGMRFGAAKSLVPGLRVGAVSSVEVEQMVGELVRDLQTFSPHVERDPVHAGVFYVDPSGLAHLYGGEASWARCVQRFLAARQFHASVVVAHGRALSYALARVTRGVRVFERAEQALEKAREVSFERLAMQPKLRAALERIGLSTLGDLALFGADQLRLRFGAEAARWGAVVRGQEVMPLCPEPHVDTPRREVEIEPPDADVARLCFGIKQALDQLVEDVRQRGASVRALWLRLEFERGGEEVQRLEPSASTRNAPLLLELLRLRLTSLHLAEGEGTTREQKLISRVVLEAELTELAPGQMAIFAPKRDLSAGDRALARLRASYGDDVVCRAVLEDAHLPEAKYRWTSLSHMELPTRRDKASRAESAVPDDVAIDGLDAYAPAPLVRRVLLKPEPLAGSFEVDPGTGQLALVHAGERLSLCGPYRVNGGWWVREVARDYYYARTPRDQWLWVFFDVPRNAWFLHALVD